MTVNKKTDEKKPGEKKSGKFHYNPGNMSGKEAGVHKEQSEREKASGQFQSREDLEKQG